MILSRLWRAASLVFAFAPLAVAQNPSRKHYTIATTHFRVSFTAPLEGVARRVAADAERAYAQLSAELHPPRGTIDVLVTDDFDFSNGSATPFPTNRIIVYAMPPVNDFGLRYTTDWTQLVVTHELTHIFQLDRARGIWKVGQWVFGRSPVLFPNLYQPSWLIEGLAVYEESRLAGQGRIEGPEHTLLARAAARDHVFPGIGQISLARPTFPGGSSAYVFGSLFMDYLARTRGDSSVRRFVESSSAQLVPFLIDLPARRAFGTTFGRAFDEWRKTIEASVAGAPAFPLPGWKDLSGGQLAAQYPRWIDDRTLTYTATNGREVLSAFAVTTDGVTRRLGRRDGLSPSVKLPDGSLLFSQYQYVDPYTYRSDLYTRQEGGRTVRLTHDERLFTADARADGAIVAMQVVAGATRLVRVSSGGVVTPITRVNPDTLWSEPRWSHSGGRIVASRWIRGGVAQIVIIDSLGAEQTVVASGRYVLASPSWTANDRGIVYSAGTAAANEAWTTLIDEGRTFRLTHSDAGFFEPEVNGRNVSGLTLRGDGYRLGVGEAPIGGYGDSLPMTTTVDPRLPSLAADSSKPRPYSALRQLIPRYWLPIAEGGVDDEPFRVGGYTEAWDVLRRHYVYAGVAVPTEGEGVNASVMHQYRGLGTPVITTTATQDWTTSPVYARTTPPTKLGTLDRRIRDAELLTTFVRPRVRSSASLSVGGGLERREYFGRPAQVLTLLDTGNLFRRADFPLAMVSATYARYRVPPFAISPEDGFSAVVTARERFRSGFNASGGPSMSVVGATSLFKSLDLPGFAHHVLAARVSGGWADTRTNANFEVGGVSGGTLEVVPGYTVGEGRRSFPVRGFPTAAVFGIRAVTASAEYRAPLFLGHHGLGTLPLFTQRSALTVFADYGSAWCPSTLAGRQVCTTAAQEERANLASTGGEISVDLGLLSWDAPTRLRLGYASPILNGGRYGGSGGLYLTTGISF